RPGQGLPEVPAQGAPGAVRHGRGAGRRFAAFPGGGAGPGGAGGGGGGAGGGGAGGGRGGGPPGGPGRRGARAAPARGRPPGAALALLGGGGAYEVRLRQALTEARAERREAQERLIRLNVETGMDLVDSGQLPLSLPLLVEALRITSEVGREKPGRAQAERMQRVRLALVLRECPRLLRVWFHEGRAYNAAFSPDGSRVVSAGAGGFPPGLDPASAGAA